MHGTVLKGLLNTNKLNKLPPLFPRGLTVLHKLKEHRREVPKNLILVYSGIKNLYKKGGPKEVTKEVCEDM